MAGGTCHWVVGLRFPQYQRTANYNLAWLQVPASTWYAHLFLFRQPESFQTFSNVVARYTKLPIARTRMPTAMIMET